MFVLTTAEGILAPVEERVGFRDTAMGAFNSFMGTKSKETPFRPQLTRLETATVSSYACFSSLTGANEGKIKFGDTVAVRFNHLSGACMRMDPSSDPQTQQIQIMDPNFDAQLCSFLVHSAQGKSVGTTVQFGDWITLQSAPHGAHPRKPSSTVTTPQNA